MAKLNKNQQALQENERALEKAKVDLLKAQTTVQRLTAKIPELERAVAALRVLCGTKPMMFRNSKTGLETPVRALSPEEIAVAASCVCAATFDVKGGSPGIGGATHVDGVVLVSLGHVGLLAFPAFGSTHFRHGLRARPIVPACDLVRGGSVAAISGLIPLRFRL